MTAFFHQSFKLSEFDWADCPRAAVAVAPRMRASVHAAMLLVQCIAVSFSVPSLVDSATVGRLKINTSSRARRVVVANYLTLEFPFLSFCPPSEMKAPQNCEP